MQTGKRNIPKECRIGYTCFMSVVAIGGFFFNRHPKNMNHVHRDCKYLMSVIITLVTNVSGGETLLLME